MACSAYIINWVPSLYTVIFSSVVFKLTHFNVTDAAAEELNKILLLMLGCAVQVGIIKS